MWDAEILSVVYDLIYYYQTTITLYTLLYFLPSYLLLKALRRWLKPRSWRGGLVAQLVALILFVTVYGVVASATVRVGSGSRHNTFSNSADTRSRADVGFICGTPLLMLPETVVVVDKKNGIISNRENR